MNISAYKKQVLYFFCFLLKNTLLSISLFSTTNCYLFYVTVVMIAIFSKEQNNYRVYFCYYIMGFLIIGWHLTLPLGVSKAMSLLVCVFLNIKTTYFFLENLMGAPFLGKHYPITKLGFRGIYPVIIYTFTIFLLIGINNLSLKLFLSIKDYKIDLLQQEKALFIKEENT